jgi:hypothetical protein
VRISVPLLGLLLYTVVILAGAFGIAVLVVEWRGDGADDGAEGPAAEGTSAPSEISSSEAELAGVAHLIDFTERFPSSDEKAALTDGFAPYCDAVERTGEGWLVRCGFRHTDGREFPRLFDLQVEDDGTVATDEEES